MLLFSEVEEPETAAEIAEAFDEPDDDTYETEISGLLKRAHGYDCEHGQKEAWDDALTALRGADYYLLVMANQAGLRPPRPPGDTLKLLLTAMVVVIIGLPLGLLVKVYGPDAWKRFEHRFLPNDVAHWIFFLLCIVAVWGLGKLMEKTGALDKLLKIFVSNPRGDR